MNAISIDSLTLPSLSLNEHSQYAKLFATPSRVQSKGVLYIGKIANLTQRWEEVTITQKALKKSTAKNKHSLFHE